MNDRFGDADPEDAWDPDDPLPHLVDNVLRRVALIAGLHQLDAMAQRRLEMVLDDLHHIRERAGG